MNEYSPIRIFKCGFLKCSKTTEDWFKEGWGITGLRDDMLPNLGGTKTIPREPFEETNFARRLLEHGKKIKATDLAAVLLCPDHKEILSQAQPLREEHEIQHNEFVQGCWLCPMQTEYARTREANP